MELLFYTTVATLLFIAVYKIHQSRKVNNQIKNDFVGYVIENLNTPADDYIPANIIDPLNADEPIVRDFVLNLPEEEIETIIIHSPFEENIPKSKSIGKTKNLPTKNLEKLQQFITTPNVVFIGFSNKDLTQGTWHQYYGKGISKNEIDVNLFDRIIFKFTVRHPQTYVVSHVCAGCAEKQKQALYL